MSADLQSFVSLVTQAQSPDDSVRAPAYEVLNNMRNSAPFQFLRALVAVLQVPEGIVPALKRVCMIYAANLLNTVHSPNPTQTTQAYIREQAGDAVTTLMGLCPRFFTEFPGDAASLFAQLAKILLDGGVPVIQTFVEQTRSVQDPRFIQHAFIALQYVAEENYLSPEQYQPLLKWCYEMLSGQSPIELKNEALKVIKNMIPDIDAVFSSEANCKSILDMLAFAIQQNGLKVTAYNCYSQIVENYFSVFAQIAEATVQIVFTDLSSDGVDADIVKAGGYFLDQIAQAELENETQVISRAIFPMALPVLTKLYVRHMDTDVWDAGYYDEHTQVIDALIDLMGAAGDVCFEPVMQFVKENANHQAPQVRELASVLLSHICSQFRDRLDGILAAVVEFCEAKLRDPQVRVRETALAVVHGLVDAKELSEPTQQAAQKLLPGMLERIADGPVVGMYVCDIIVRFAEHGILNTFQPLFNQLLGMMGHDDQPFIACLTDALLAILDNLKDYPGFQQSIGAILEITQKSFTDPALKRNQSFIIDVFCKACRKVSNPQLLAPAAGPLFELFIGKFRQTGTTDSLVLLAIASLGCSVGPAFEPCLTETMNLALRLLQTPDVGAVSLRDATYSIIALNRYFDLSPFIDGLCRATLETTQAMDGDYNALISLVHFMDELIRRDETSPLVLPFIVPTVHMIKEPIAKIADLVDRKQAWTFSIDCLRFMGTLYKLDQSAFQQWIEIEYMLVFKVIQLNKWKDPIKEELVGFIALLADANAEALGAFMSQNECVAQLLANAKENGYADQVKKVETALKCQL